MSLKQVGSIAYVYSDSTRVPCGSGRAVAKLSSLLIRKIIFCLEYHRIFPKRSKKFNTTNATSNKRYRGKDVWYS